MVAFRIPGPLCVSDVPPLDDGTLTRWWSRSPGPLVSTPSGPLQRRSYNYSRAGGFAASTLTLSPPAADLLKAIEELRLQPYDDQTGKDINAWVAGATIGYGHLIAKSEWNTYKGGITQQQADELFRRDAEPFEKVVGDTITVGVQQYEFDAMVILAFNIGETGFRGSTVARLVNKPDPVDGLTKLETAWKAWNKSQGKVNKGLINRRAAEWRIYTQATYERW